MASVLATPVEFFLSNRRYGKSYNILNNLRASDITVDAYVGRAIDPLDLGNVTIHQVGSYNKLTYYLASFLEADRQLSAGTVDIYHHMNLSYRWFNPILLAGRHRDTPVVIGPCQAGHQVMPEEFNNILKHGIGLGVPRAVSDPLFSVITPIRKLFDPARIELFKRTLEQANRIVVVHNEAKDLYSKFVPNDKLTVIPLGVDPETFTYSESGETPTIVAIGSLRYRKGYDTLIDALPEVVAEFPRAHLHIFGDGPLRSDLEQQAADRNVDSAVTFHGYVEQSTIRDHLHTASVFVHPSRSESFSLVRLEAMATGCPVVVSDISGAKEMVREGVEGYVISSRAPERWAERIVTILADSNLAAEIGRCARRRVEEKYDWRTIGNQYLEVYRSLL